jgi:5-formyltetrahydrofolate cyclo-ligase
MLGNKDLEWVAWDGEESSLLPHPIQGNLREPQGEAFASEGAIDIVITPALHVDRSGNRLGQGGGSYDRALARINGWKIALLHHGELTSDHLPIEDHDQKVDAAATPDLIARFAVI